MDRQAELSRLYEVKSKLEEIEALNNTIESKREVLKARKDNAHKPNNVYLDKSKYDTEHAVRAEKRLAEHLTSLSEKIRTANIRKLVLLIVGLLVIYLIVGANTIKLFLNFLSENEFIIEFDSYDEPSEMIALGLLLSMGILGVCILAIFIILMINEEKGLLKIKYHYLLSDNSWYSEKSSKKTLSVFTKIIKYSLFFTCGISLIIIPTIIIYTILLSFFSHLFPYTYLPLILISIIAIIVSKLLVRDNSDSSKEIQQLNASTQRELADARNSDKFEEQRYQSDLTILKASAKAAEVAAIAKCEKDVVPLKQEISSLEKQLSEKRQELHAIDCLHDKDKFLKIVNRLIDYIDGRRADSIKEALNMYDAECAKERAELSRIWRARLENENRRFEQSLKDEEEWKHRKEMESLARERVELERERNKQIEDFLNNN